MEHVFNVNITTRESIIYHGSASSLVAPGEMGYLGILANHAPLITNLVRGRISLKDASQKIFVFNSSGKGFLEILKNNVTVLLDSCATNS